MNRNIIVVIVLAVIIIVLAFVLFLPKTQAPSQSNNNNNNNGSGGIEVSSPKSGEVVKSPLKITGETSGNGWIGFEAQVGTVKLLDETGKVLAFGILTAQGEWMQQVINFKTTLNFTAPAATSGSLVFYNENPSGEAERNKTFSLPVKFK